MICFEQAIKLIEMIKTVFETESLLAPNDEFLKYCETIVHYGIAERFYIFTCLNQV